MKNIDTDVHQSWDGLSVYAHLPEYFRQENSHIPGGVYYNPVSVNRMDAIGPNGEPAGTSYEMMCSQHLDAFGID